MNSKNKFWFKLRTHQFIVLIIILFQISFSPNLSAQNRTLSDDEIIALAKKIYLQGGDLEKGTERVKECFSFEATTLEYVISKLPPDSPILKEVNDIESKGSVTFEKSYTTENFQAEYGEDEIFKFEIKYTLIDQVNSPPSLDSDADGHPDYVERMAGVLEFSRRQFINFGFKALSNTINVEIKDISYYGYTSPISPIVIDNALSSNSLLLTTTHELFHKVQFLYNSLGWIATTDWIYEGTAKLSEDFIFDNINWSWISWANDKLSQLDVSLPSGSYNAVLYFKYFIEQFGNVNYSANIVTGFNQINHSVDIRGADALVELWEELVWAPLTGNWVSQVDNVILDLVNKSFRTTFLDWSLANYGKDFNPVSQYMYEENEYLNSPQFVQSWIYLSSTPITVLNQTLAPWSAHYREYLIPTGTEKVRIQASGTIPSGSVDDSGVLFIYIPNDIGDLFLKPVWLNYGDYLSYDGEILTNGSDKICIGVAGLENGIEYDLIVSSVSASVVMNSGKVSPATGTTSDSFEFSVNYKDVSGQVPQNISLLIDNLGTFPMDFFSGNSTDGFNYKITKTFSEAKTYPYRFEATSSFGSKYCYPIDCGMQNLVINETGGSIWPPTITVNYPNNEICHDECFIAWSASDPDNNAAIYLYYDNNNLGFDGTCINPGDPVFKDVANVYVWNTTAMPNGKYWIYAVIDDGTNQAKDYSPGYIEVKHPQVSTDFSFSSKTTEEEVGDADEIIESGETFEMDISIKNTSTTKTYTVVSGILSTANTNVTITDYDSFFGDFATGATNWGDDDFKVEVKAGFTGNVDFDLNLEFKDASGYQYFQIIDIPDIFVSQNVTPGFEVVGIEIVDDGDHCNNDGILQSGENSIQYKLQIKNNGTGNAIDVYCEAQAMPEFVTDANTASYPDIASGTAQWCDIDDHFYLREIPANFSGTYNALVKVYWADMEFNQLIPFNLQVQPAPRLLYDPKTSDFGIQALGETAVIPVTLTNYGTSNLIISQIEDLSVNPNNSVTGLTFPATITPGSTVIAEIRIKRDNPENINSIFRIHSNNHSVATQDILISGTFYDPQPQGYKKLWESLGTYTPEDFDDCYWAEPTDLDNDGLVDIVMYKWNKLYFWEQKNTNSFEFVYKTTYVVPGTEIYIQALQVGNCDGDNKKDIVIRDYDQGFDTQPNTLRVLENSGNDTYTQVWSTLISYSYTDNIAVGNCDTDLEDEIIICSTTPDTKIILYNKTGDNGYAATWNSGTTIESLCNYNGAPTTGDIDMDGVNEIVVAGVDKYMFIWKYNSGSYSLYRSPLVSNTPLPEWSYPAFTLVKDVDNDNKNEIIITGDGDDAWKFAILNPDTWTIGFHNSPGLYDDLSSTAAADLNGNGITEIFMGEESGARRLITYEFNSGSYFETFKYTTEYGDDINNIEPVDLNNDGTSELILSNDDRFMVWGYEEPPILPDLKIAANNFTLSSLESTDKDPFTITAKIQNVGTTVASNVPVQFYLADPSNGNILKSFKIKDLLALEDTVITSLAEITQVGSFDIYVVIDQASAVEEVDETNNSQYKTITIIDNDISAPDFISHSHSELGGDNDGLIEDDEYIQISWKLSDFSGIRSTYVIFNGVIKEGISSEDGNYFTVIENQIPGNYSYEIHATDNDNTNLSSQLDDFLSVIQHAPNVISVNPSDESTGILTDSKIEVLFDLSINASTINSGNFLLSELGSGTQVSPISLSYSPEIIKVTYEPSTLKFETSYKVRILSGVNGIKDINNNSLESDLIWTFTTTTAPLDADFYITNSTLTAQTVLHFKDLTTGHPVSWFWNFGDGQLSSVQNPEHVYNTTGNYTVTLFVVDSEGKTDSKTISINLSVVSMNDRILAENFRIYPIPAKDIIYIICKTEIISAIQMSIFDNTGKVLLSESIEEFKKDIPNEIDISSLEPGIYFLRLSNKTFYKITKLIVN